MSYAKASSVPLLFPCFNGPHYMALTLYKGDCQVGLLQFVNASKNVGFDYESFIESVRPHPYLYDRNSPGFKDKVMKDGRWALIAAANGITTAQARKKWRNLRDKYHRLTKKMLKVQKELDLDNVPKTKWYYYNTMDNVLRATFETQFCITNPRPAASETTPNEEPKPVTPPVDVKPDLAKIVVQKESIPLPINNVKTTPTPAPAPVPVATSTPAPKIMIVSQPSTSANCTLTAVSKPPIITVCQPSTSAINSTPAATKIVRRKQPDPEILKWIKNTELSLGSAAKQPCLEDRDATYYFCMGLAERLRSLSRLNCLRAMNDIQNAVYKIEIEEYATNK